MYRNAQAGECPLVVDKHTPSCGNSRFGCWTCTVVKQDRSMEAMVDAGEEWLEPLLEFRNYLAGTQDPARKRALREHRRRSGRVEYWGADGDRKLIRGAYRLHVRQDIFRRLLEAQERVRQLGPNPGETLITVDELHRIRQLWRFEAGDWEDSLPRIYREVTGSTLDWPAEDWSGMGGAELAVLADVAGTHGLSSCSTQNGSSTG
jgi:DNA sulfur modification protein DndC